MNVNVKGSCGVSRRELYECHCKGKLWSQQKGTVWMSLKKERCECEWKGTMNVTENKIYECEWKETL